MHVKPIDELTDEELLALTSEQIEKRVKLRMAEDGVPIYPAPDKPELIDVEPPKSKFFTFAKVFNEILFPSVEDLRKVVDLMREMGCERKVKDWNEPIGRHEPNIIKASYGSEDEFDIKSEELYSADEYLKSKASLVENKKRETDYESELKTVNNSKKAAQGIRDEIMEPIQEAETRKYQYERADLQFSGYMELAEEDATVALKFYIKANSPEEHVEDYLREKHSVPRVVEEGGDDQ